MVVHNGTQGKARYYVSQQPNEAPTLGLRRFVFPLSNY